MKHTLTLLAALLLLPLAALQAADEDLALNYHLMHPGDDSLPGDPNAGYSHDCSKTSTFFALKKSISRVDIFHPPPRIIDANNEIRNNFEHPYGMLVKGIILCLLDTQ